MNNTFKINGKHVGNSSPTYFVADIAANHDGDLERAKDLIFMAAESGADAAKFQHFHARTIVSDYGFRHLGGQKSHQQTWKKSVYEVYKDASIDMGWTEILKDTCSKAGIAFFTSPYSLDLVDAVDEHVSAYKIGSCDITWHKIIKKIASKNKPYMIATGASSINEVQMAVDLALDINPSLALMQCNTNYTGSVENFKYIHLNVLKVYQKMFPSVVLGLSDHTPGHSTVLGAIAFGARIIEKHFTDSQKRDGPDHAFSLDPTMWTEMIKSSRELEASFGDGNKKIEPNEADTVVLQRRSLRFTKDLSIGRPLVEEDFEELRPCPEDAVPPYRMDEIIGRELKQSKLAGEYLRWIDLK